MHLLDAQEKVVAHNVERLRKEKGLTYQELADQAGVRRATLFAFVTGQRRPRFGFVHSLAGALGVSLDDLARPNGVSGKSRRQRRVRVAS